MQEITRLRALCAECGNLRTVAANYNAPHDVNRTDETSDGQRGWRCTATLKCSVCGAKTCHALLRSDDDPFRDVAELREHERQATIVAAAAGFNLPAGALAGLTHDDLRWTNAELQTEALRQIRRVAGALPPDRLTPRECASLLKLLKSFVDKRGDGL